MDGSAKSAVPDRWWIVALCVAILGPLLAILLSNYPTSKLVWCLAGGILLFVVVTSLNPRYRYWRRANSCFTTAALLACVPTLVVKANLTGIGIFEFTSDTSPLTVLGFLGAGLFLAWLDSRQQVQLIPKSAITVTNSNLRVVNSPGAITGLTAGGNIVINQGISEETLVAAFDMQRLIVQTQTNSPSQPPEVDDELIWRLIDDIKAARRRLEREEVATLIADLQKRFEHSGGAWANVLRTEAILLLAEEERSRICQLRMDGHQVDLARLQELLKELPDART